MTAAKKQPTDWQTLFENWHAAHESDDAAHDIHHFKRVWNVCRDIAATEDGADMDVLLAGAYFHDVVNPPKDSPLRSKASRLAGDKAVEILTEMGFPHEKLEAVRHAIAAHSFSANIPAETLEAKILQDADRMEALGAIGQARCFYVSGRLNRPLFDPQDPLAEHREADDGTWGDDHFFCKLLKIPGKMQTERGRQIAARRAQVLEDYLTELKAEVLGA